MSCSFKVVGVGIKFFNITLIVVARMQGTKAELKDVFCIPVEVEDWLTRNIMEIRRRKLGV